MSDARLVMIVEDDRDLREALGEFLRCEGYRTILYRDCLTALNRLRSGPERPNVILLDLMMPVMNGWEFRRHQLEDPIFAAIPVVVMTASSSIEDIDADELLFKPPNIDQLVEVIRRHATTDGQDFAEGGA